MRSDPSPFVLIMANQRYQYELTSPYYLALDERIVECGWPSERSHWHDHFEIEIILDGNGTHLYDGSHYTLRRGCAYLLTPTDIHSLIPDPDSHLHLIHLRFDERAVSEDVRQWLLQHDYSKFAQFSNEAFERFSLMLKELSCCFESTDPFRKRSIQLLLSYICLFIMKQSNPNPTLLPMDEGINPAVRKTMLYIHYNFRKKISMQELGANVHMSPNHLAMLFKRSVGTTCMQLVGQLRLHYAVKMLNSTSLSIDTVAEMSGFSSVSYFISIFRKEFGITPKDYRKHVKEDPNAPNGPLPADEHNKSKK